MEKEYEAYFESLSEGDEVLSFAEFKEALSVKRIDTTAPSSNRKFCFAPR